MTEGGKGTGEEKTGEAPQGGKQGWDEQTPVIVFGISTRNKRSDWDDTLQDLLINKGGRAARRTYQGPKLGWRY